MSKDEIFADGSYAGGPFRFDEAVARVFPDMLQRSIPGYAASLEAVGSLAARYVKAGTNCYDLGCSLGAATLAMLQGIRAEGCNIVAVDSAPAMIDRCRAAVREFEKPDGKGTTVAMERADIRDVDIRNASMVVLNYTLQFVPVEAREALLQKVCAGLLPGGILVLSEKVVDEDPHMNQLLVDLHHEHKRRNAYSELEISRKRAALENVLVPETVTAHFERLDRVGFAHRAIWLRYFNFVSIVAIR